MVSIPVAMIITQQLCAVDSQATVDSRTLRQIFVRRKSVEKIWLAEFTAEFCPPKIHQKKRIFE